MKIELTPQQVRTVFDQIMMLAEKGTQEPPLPKAVLPVQPGCDSGINALCDNESISELLTTVTQYENSYGDNCINTRIGMWMRAIPNLSAENALDLCNRLRNAQLYYHSRSFDKI
jgi:hypothetical protein